MLHKTASPAEFLTTMRAMGGLKAGLGGGAQPQSSLLRQHLADATSEEVRSIPIRPVQKVCVLKVLKAWGRIREGMMFVELRHSC